MRKSGVRFALAGNCFFFLTLLYRFLFFDPTFFSFQYKRQRRSLPIGTFVSFFWTLIDAENQRNIVIQFFPVKKNLSWFKETGHILEHNERVGLLVILCTNESPSARKYAWTVVWTKNGYKDLLDSRLRTKKMNPVTSILF